METQTDIEFSGNVKKTSFLAMVCVVAIHSHALGTHAAPPAWCVFLQQLLFRDLTCWAVPFFFTASGFFFGKWLSRTRTGEFFSVSGVPSFWKKKLRTLLVPYLVWAVAGAAITVPLVIANNAITHNPVLDRTFLAKPGLWRKIDALFGITGNGPSGNLALWYVRSLLVMFAAAPAFFVIAKFAKLALPAAGLALVLLFPETAVPHVAVKCGSIGWLATGISLAVFGFETKWRTPRTLFWASGAVFAAICVWNALATAGTCPAPHQFALAAAPVPGIVFAWSLSQRILRGGRLPECFGMTFWVYCLHGALTGWALAGVSFAMGKTGVSAMVASFISIAWALGASLISGFFLKKRLPRVYSAMSGGR